MLILGTTFVLMSMLKSDIYVKCQLSSVKCQVAYVDPWDMLNNFCCHVYAQNSLFIGENVNGFFDTLLIITLSCLEFIELVPS